MTKRADLVSQLKQRYYPDILDCMAQISPNEIPTPPKIVQEMLAMLPQELFSNPNTKFLDPCSKSAVFLREIARKLIDGLADKIPDLEKRLNHIFTKQLYGISITELTGLVSRRTLYCSKEANSRYSVCKFDNSDGNIFYERVEHKWEGNKCVFCGASKKEWNRGKDFETHAYSFIHSNSKLLERLKDMKFDVIIGNPPYQLNDGGAQASASPLYHLFVNQAKKLNPRYLTMIIPSRWFAGGKGLDDFRKEMIHDRHFKILHDFVNAKECFQSVDVKGGVCYFLWSRETEQKCDIYRHDDYGIFYSKRYLVEGSDDIFIRYQEVIPIKHKIQLKHEDSFINLVSSRKPYGLCGDLFEKTKKYGLPEMSEHPLSNGYEVVGLSHSKRISRFIPKNYPIPKREMLNDYKIFITRNYGSGEMGEIPSTPILASPGMLCTETFIQIGPFQTEIEMKNCLSYMKTKFFRCMVGIRKQDQGASKSVYKYVPMQDFSKSWTDEKLYKKYNLTQEEINFIESMIKPMA